MVVSALLGIYSLHHMRTKGRSPVLSAFFAVDVGLVLWTGFSALKLLHTTPAVKLLFYKLLYLGVAPLGPLVFLFVLVHTDRIRRIRPRHIVTVLSIPLVFLVILFTNPSDLAIETPRFIESNGLVLLRVDVGPAHLLLQLLYNAVLSTAAVGIILYEAFRLGRSYIQQAILVSIGIAAPFIFALFSSLGVPPFNPEGVNLVPTSAAVTSLAIGIAVFRYRFLELPPLAYTTAMEASPDGVFVLDPNERIVHVNNQGASFLEQFAADVGDPITKISPKFDLTTSHDDSVRVTLDDGTPMFLSVRSQRLTRQDQVVGWVIVFRDVTDLHRQKQMILDQNEKLRLLNQIIRHDIRNDTAVVLGNARLVDEMVDDEAVSKRLKTIIRNSEHTAELTDTVRNLMKTMLEDEETAHPTSIGGVLWDEANEIIEGNPNAVVDLPDERPDVSVMADDMLGTVFRNLLTNAIRHNDTPEPGVTISVEEQPDTVLVRIADNGPGIPNDRKDEIFGRGEKGFESPGTGLGLYLVDTIVSDYGGDVWVEDNTPRGAVFVTRLRKSELGQSDPGSNRQLSSPEEARSK